MSYYLGCLVNVLGVEVERPILGSLAIPPMTYRLALRELVVNEQPN